MATTEMLPQLIPGMGNAWRQFILDPPFFNDRARHYLEQRILKFNDEHPNIIAEVYAGSRSIQVRVNYPALWDNLASLRQFIAEQIREVAASGR